MKSYININGEQEARPVEELSPPGSVHEYPSPIEATGVVVAQEADSAAPRSQEEQVVPGEDVVSSSEAQACSSSSDSNDAAGHEANAEASGASSSKLNVEMSVNSSYSRVEDKLRITIELSVPMRSVSRNIDGVNVKLVDSEFKKVVRLADDHRQSQLQPRCSLTSRHERPIAPTMTQLEFEWNEYMRRQPSIPDISVDVNVNGGAAAGGEVTASTASTVKLEEASVPEKPPRQQTTPEPPLYQSQEEFPERRPNFDLEDIEKMLGIIPRVEKPSLLDKPGPVGAFAQTSNFVMNEPLKKMIEKQQQLREKARAMSSKAATEAAASVPAPVAFRDRQTSRSDQTDDSRSTTTSTTTTTATKTKTSSTQNDPPSYSTCVSQSDPARDQQRPSLIQYAPPSYSAAVTQQFEQEMTSSAESFMSLLERQHRLTSSTDSNVETAPRTSTPNLATFLRPPRTSPRPMISPSAPPHPANPEAEFYNNMIETVMKRAGPFANQLDLKTVLANARYPLMPEPWVPEPMRPYIIGNEEPYRGPDTAAEYLKRVAEVRQAARVAAVPAQQRPPQRTADLAAGDQGAVARPPAPRTPNPEVRVEASPPAYQRSDYDLRVQRAPRSVDDPRVQRAPQRADDPRIQRAPPAAPRSEYDLRIQRSPPASPSLELDPSSVVCDIGMDLRNSLANAGLPSDLRNLSEAEYDRALSEMHRVMERAKSVIQNLKR